MLRRPFCGQIFEDSKQVYAGALFYISPGSVGVVILALHALVEAFQCFLDTDGLVTIRIIKHYAHRLVTRVTNCLHPRVLLGDVVAVRGRIAPLDFQGVSAHQGNLRRKVSAFCRVYLECEPDRSRGISP